MPLTRLSLRAVRMPQLEAMDPQDWLELHALVPEGLPERVGACFTLRTGGTSPEPWRSFNLGDHVGDDPKRVALHRQHLAQAVGHPLCFVNQVHGCEVLKWHARGDGHTAPGQPPGTAPKADALWTDLPDQACVIMVADCLPVLWWSTSGDVVAASHAGWRGLLGASGRGVLEATHEVLSRHHPQAQWQAWLGPCIGPTAFEVGSEVRAAFVADQARWADWFYPHPERGGKHLADLPGMARERLKALGLQSIGGHDGTKDWCTVGDAERYFSHRRDGHVQATGRMAAVIWRQS